MPRTRGDLLTIPQAADRLGISQARMYRLVNTGRIPGEWVAGRMVVRAPDVECRENGLRVDGMTTSEFAAAVGRSVPTVQAWCRDGVVESHLNDARQRVITTPPDGFDPPRPGRPRKVES